MNRFANALFSFLAIALAKPQQLEGAIAPLSFPAIATLVTMSITLGSVIAIATILKEFERLLQY